MNLRALGERLLGRGLLEEVDLILATVDQTLKDLAASHAPLRQLLRGNLVRILALVQALDESRGLRVTAADIENPRGQGSPLVVVELNLAAVEKTGEAGAVLGKVVLKQLLGSGFSQRELVLHLGTALLLAEVSVANSREADRVGCGLGNEALPLLDQVNSGRVEVLAVAARGFAATAAALRGHVAIGASFDVVVRYITAIGGLVPDVVAADAGSGGLASDLHVLAFLVRLLDGVASARPRAAVDSVASDRVGAGNRGDGQGDGGEGSELHCEL